MGTREEKLCIYGIEIREEVLESTRDAHRRFHSLTVESNEPGTAVQLMISPGWRKMYVFTAGEQSSICIEFNTVCFAQMACKPTSCQRSGDVPHEDGAVAARRRELVVIMRSGRLKLSYPSADGFK